MIGSGYWSTGITVRYGYSGDGLYGWSARAGFYDDGFADDDTDAGQVSTEGVLKTRSFVTEGNDADALTVAVDTVKRDAERLGIRFDNGNVMTPMVHYDGDGGNEDYPPPPGWRELVNAQSRRLGWRTAYREEVPR